MSPVSRRRILGGIVGGLCLSGMGVTASAKTRPLKNPLRLGSRTTLPGPQLIVGFRGQDPIDDEVQSIARDIEADRVAGVLLLGRNVSSIEQVRSLCDFLTGAGKRAAPMICIDHEGGAVARAAPGSGFTPWASAADLGSRLVAEKAAAAYYAPRAAELAAAGITLNFGPVVDLNLNPANPIIGALGRSYHADPARVFELAKGFVGAHRQAGIRTSLKHFPGHGSANGDTHLGLVDISDTWSELELEPYREMISSGFADSVMNAHIYHPSFSDEKGRPASLSTRTIEVLRGDLGFDGAVVSDDMQMGAITEHFLEEGAAIMAVAAGSDLLIYSTFDRADPVLAQRIEAVLSDAVLDGRLDRRKLEASKDRIDALRPRL